ncbi:MAG: magnesium/cobalt transporter CorA [Cellulomonas sp.]|nr:magnesium/cobalt transporter CorA [Cellulomonas sp.]
MSDDSRDDRPRPPRLLDVQLRPAGLTLVRCIDYCPTRVEVQAVEDLTAFLRTPRPDWSTVRWIEVVGMKRVTDVEALSAQYDLHPLAVEDVFSREQRPKVDAYGGQGSELAARLLVTARELHASGNRIKTSPVSIFLGHTTVLTFQHADTAVWRPTRQRLEQGSSRARGADASFLLYTLLDAVVDAAFPLLEHLEGRLDRLEGDVLDEADRSLLVEIQDVKRDLVTVRAAIWPLREVVANLQRDQHECMSATTQIYLHDLRDHIVQVIELIEGYRERARDLTESYRTSLSARSNDTMKVLTIIGTIFIPLTFLAGVYGMNFRVFPELGWSWGYPMFWVVCIVVAVGMVRWFRRQGWW